MPRGSFLQHVNSDCISSMPNSGEMTTSSDFTMSSQAMNAGFGCEYKYYSTTLDSLPVSFSELDLTSSGVIPGIDLPLLVSRGVLQSNEDSSEGAFADFALVFTGALEITTAGLYNFYTASNDGSKLYLNDELIVDNDGKHYVVEKQGNIELCTGFHAFRLEYFHTCGKLLEGIREGAYLSFQYSFKGTSWYGTDAIRKQEIPLTRLRLPRLIDINEDLSKSKTSRSRATSSAMSGLSSSEKMPALDMATLDAEEKWRHYEGVIEKLTIERDEYAKRVTELKDAKARMKEQHKKDLTDIRATHLADTEYLKQHLFISMVASHKQNIAATNATVGALPAGANVSAQDLFELAEKYGVSANKWERFILDALHKGTAQCERDLQDDEQILTFTDGFTKSAKITGSSTSQSLEVCAL
ncbi:hypothetical protein, variant [Sphaeroforma arctica JP610]|uniref:PA14 domain-containing protein n=1 Tax=Sphaeroforma arctica JP610 TaxID=667725 RepID=A0A0L0FXJ2_9EUKA|nr:hypothetical protein, variant [Sphaeroforma arctica JP610]KNC81364.1 hypothetical protein, variant [Sphaeroforma arctica JP610]|eukprot:XP_014155266.1 hypothetical protein, variant [Sphaeroforma arctica JP610]